MTLIAYHNDPAIKAAVLAQIQAHHDADEIVKGRYWEDGKGCAVGCTIHSDDHAEYESRFGIPQMLARLEDCIFEGLPNGTAKAWPIRFMSAIKPGTDLSRVGWHFLYWLLTDETGNPGINHPLVKDAVRQCADILVPLMTKGGPVDEKAAGSAARAAVVAYLAAGARQAGARRAAVVATWAMRSAADLAAAGSADAAAAYAAADAAARAAAAAYLAAAGSGYIRMADKLIALIEAA